MASDFFLSLVGTLADMNSFPTNGECDEIGGGGLQNLVCAWIKVDVHEGQAIRQL